MGLFITSIVVVLVAWMVTYIFEFGWPRFKRPTTKDSQPPEKIKETIDPRSIIMGDFNTELYYELDKIKEVITNMPLDWKYQYIPGNSGCFLLQKYRPWLHKPTYRQCGYRRYVYREEVANGVAHIERHAALKQTLY